MKEPDKPEQSTPPIHSNRATRSKARAYPTINLRFRVGDCVNLKFNGEVFCGIITQFQDNTFSDAQDKFYVKLEFLGSAPTTRRVWYSTDECDKS